MPQVPECVTITQSHGNDEKVNLISAVMAIQYEITLGDISEIFWLNLGPVYRDNHLMISTCTM